MLGLFLVGRRFGGGPLGVALAFGWLAFPFTAYALNANSNDAIMPAFLVWGFWLCTSSFRAGRRRRAVGLDEVRDAPARAALAHVPERLAAAVRRSGSPAASSLATLAVFSILLLEPSLIHAVRVFVDRTFDYQFGRDSPFSPWDWGQYHARGIPDLSAFQVVLQIARARAAPASRR